jgi:sec-independent protein translocase protein TatC
MALLERVLRRGPYQTRDVEDSRMTVVEHLEALRRALIISMLAWVTFTIVAFFFSSRIFDLLLARGNIGTAYFHAPTGAFILELKIALYLGFVLAAPVIIWQAWWFVSPGLYSRERRAALPLIVATIVFFAIGIGFALFALPLILRVLTAFAPPHVQYFPFVDDYLSFVLALVIGFGLVFELPVVLYVLGILRIISSGWLYRHRAYWIIALGLIANFLTPGADPLTPLIMFVPLYIFWEGTALLLRLTGH